MVELSDAEKHAEMINMSMQMLQLDICGDVESDRRCSSSTVAAAPPPLPADNSGGGGGGHYCIDSIEPKTVYLKTLLDELGTEYSKKQQLILANKRLLNTLTHVNMSILYSL